MKNILYFLLLSIVLGFKSISHLHANYILRCSNNEEPTNNRKVKIMNIDFRKMIKEIDNKLISEVYNNSVPLYPQNESEIKHDSFEGYLKTIFNVMKDEKKNINFDIFYNWKTRAGTFLTKEELYNVYHTINEDGKCNLMNFILLNRIIDENEEKIFK